MNNFGKNRNTSKTKRSSTKYRNSFPNQGQDSAFRSNSFWDRQGHIKKFGKVQNLKWKESLEYYLPAFDEKLVRNFSKGTKMLLGQYPNWWRK